jgi:MPBQ/MSBQ methyltransferase
MTDVAKTQHTPVFIGHSGRAQANPPTSGIVRSYYETSTTHYASWSEDYNLHFGFYRWGVNPLNREAMLQSMNEAVVTRLCLGAAKANVIDLGCGTGATARSLAKLYRNVIVEGITLSPAQVKLGRSLNAKQNFSVQIHLREGNYTALPYAAASFDSAYAVESACHAAGEDKAALIREAARVLKPGARFVIADAMRRDSKPMHGLLGYAYRIWCRSWAVPELAERDALVAALKAEGFTDIRIEDISLRVAPSAAHIPVVATRFLLRTIFDSASNWLRNVDVPKAETSWRWRHIAASYLSLMLGFALHRIGYFIVTATRSKSTTIESRTDRNNT